MMSKSLKKLTAGIITMAAIFAVNPIVAHAEWRQDPTGWWYADGDSWYTGWKQVDGKWYYFMNDGYMAHNCYISNKYHLNSSGVWDSTIQGFTIQRPSNWTRMTSSDDKTYYKIDDAGTGMNELIANLQGKSEKDSMDEVTNMLKNRSDVQNLAISSQTFNGKSAQVIDYKYSNSNLNKVFQVHQVIFFNNNESYIFTFEAPNEISGDNMNSINNFLNTINY